MSKARLRSDKILSKKIDLLKIETDGRLKNEQVQKITDEISNLRNEAAGNEKLTQRLDTLEKNLNQKIKKPASKIRTNQVAVAPAPENHASPALTKAFLRYSKLAKQTPVKRMAKYKTENFTAENDLAMVKLAESSLTEIETLLDKYSKALNSFCNRKMKNSKPGTKPLNEDVEYSTAKNLSEQLRQIKTEIQEAGPLTKKMAAVKKN